MPTGMTRSFGKLVSDPGMEPRVRRALDRFSRPYLWVDNQGAYLDDEGRVSIRLNGTTLSQTADGLRVNPSGSPVVAGLTITGFNGFLYASNGVVSAVTNVATTLYSSVTSQGNTQPNETDLFSYSVPGGTLAATGDSLEFAGCGTFTSGTARRLKVKFGSTTVLDTGSFTTTASSWSIRGSVTRTGATTQKVESAINTSVIATTTILVVQRADIAGLQSAPYVAQTESSQSYDLTDHLNSANYTTASETLADAINLKITGFHATTSNVVVGERFKVIKQPG